MAASSPEDSLLTSAMVDSLASMERRSLLLPMLLFVAAHRPLAFMAGQMLHLGAPSASLLGFTTMNLWAELLSDPKGAALLERILDKIEPIY